MWHGLAVPKRRLGVALLVPPPWDREIDGLRRALGDGALGRMPPHLTLVPPVNVREDRLDDALAVVRRAAAGSAPVTVSLGPTATFLPATPVLYLTVGGLGLPDVHRLREAVFAEPLHRPLTHPFEPHVTLADEVSADRIGAAGLALADYAIEVTFDRVHLLEEGPGRVWRPVADAALEAPAVVARGGLELELAVSEHLDVEAAASAQAWSSTRGAPAPVAVTARRNGLVVGTVAGWVRDDVAQLAELVVAPAERRQGVGSHLLARFLAEAAGRGARLARTAAAPGTPAEAFLLARGWSARSATSSLDLVRHLHP